VSTAVKLVAFGAAGYIAYRWLAGQSSSPASSATPGVTPAAIAPSQLDIIYPKMLAAAAAEGVGADGAGLDAWNVYAIRGGAPSPEPAPEDVFGPLSQADRTRKYTAAEFWSKMAPYLKAHMGLTGLGFFGNLCCGGGRS
jgi:hypothetical protein